MSGKETDTQKMVTMLSERVINPLMAEIAQQKTMQSQLAQWRAASQRAQAAAEKKAQEALIAPEPKETSQAQP